jgi:hypothetical protein
MAVVQVDELFARSPSARSPNWQATRSIDVSHAESALVQLGDGPRPSNLSKSAANDTRTEPSETKSHQPYRQSGGRRRLGMSIGRSRVQRPSTRSPFVARGATPGATPGAAPAAPGVRKGLILRGFLRSYFKVAERILTPVLRASYQIRRSCNPRLAAPE